jgi:hypothetical protein
MNQNNTANFTVLKTYKIRGGYLNSTMTFEVQGDIVRIRHYCTLNDPNRYEPCFHVTPPGWASTDRTIEAEVWYSIKIAREVYKHMTREEKNNPEYVNHTPFVPVP